MHKVKFSLWRSCSLMIFSLFLAGGSLGWNAVELLAIIGTGKEVGADFIFSMVTSFALLTFAVLGARISALSISMSLDTAYGQGQIDGGKILSALFTDEEIAMRRVKKEIMARELAGFSDNSPH